MPATPNVSSSVAESHVAEPVRSYTVYMSAV